MFLYGICGFFYFEINALITCPKDVKLLLIVFNCFNNTGSVYSPGFSNVLYLSDPAKSTNDNFETVVCFVWWL